MNRKKIVRYCHFTLIELIASMSIFTIIMFVLISFFNSAQKAWTSSSNRTMVFENARVAMDLITRDLQAAYYEDGKIPFWHKDKAADADIETWKTGSGSTSTYYCNELLAFVSATDIPPNETCKSKLCEIKYQKYYAKDRTYPNHKKNEGWLKRSATDDTSTKWNFYNDFNVSLNTAGDAFTAGGNSSKNYEKVIPCVIDLTFTCYNKDGSVIAKDNPGSSTTGSTTAFPYFVKIELTLMDKDSWNKWIQMGGNVDPSKDTGDILEFRQKHQRKFTKIVYIGDRGQYE